MDTAFRRVDTAVRFTVPEFMVVVNIILIFVVVGTCTKRRTMSRSPNIPRAYKRAAFRRVDTAVRFEVPDFITVVNTFLILDIVGTRTKRRTMSRTLTIPRANKLSG